MEPLSIEAARKLIARIRVEKGEISPEVRASSHPEVLEALANVRRDLGRTAKTFVDQLYSKDTRFVYELIQNAEDNTYTRAEGKIYLGFSLYPDRLVLDSNEDGFREEDVRAICNVGASTKAVSQGFIGEKGIGFKSVFKVAKKVHVQSHPFSFSFSYRNFSSDDALGMITPYEEDYDRLPEGVNTRITLTLLDPSSFEQRADELLTLPDTLLLFLPKLPLLRIKIYPQSKKATEIMYTHASHENKLETITKITTSDGESAERNIHFYVLRRDIRDLSPDKARQNNKATVVLAFPMDVAQTPIIEKQPVFAFLPLRKLGFTFLIQSDFITQANREDVVHSERNKDLLLGVAETFRDAVLHFCQQPILRYQWMRYLPDDSISDEFWRELKPLIVSLLKDTPMLLPWSETTLRLPSEVYYLPDWFRDKYGQPLFADSEEEEYLSPHYTSDDLKRLDPLGLKQVHWDDILARFHADLKTKNPKMRINNPIDEDWHMRVAKLFAKALSLESDSLHKRIKSLELIPLQGSTPVSANVKHITRWVTAENMPIYFPNTGHIPIPVDLGLDLVEQTAASNNERRILFSQLGVINASSNDIVSLIIKRYISSSICTMDENIAHLQYLYWNLPQDTPDLARTIYLFDKEGQAVLCIQSHMQHMYFEEEEGGWQQLLKRGPIENRESSGLDVHFLNSKYIDAVLTTELQHGRSWKQWLSEVVGVQSYPQLLNPGGNSLSDEFRYIIKYRPEKLVCLLKRFWPVYEHKIKKLPTVVSELSSCHVPSDGDVKETLGSTFLPLPRLKDLARGLGIVDFPFLTMPEELTEENGNEWQFLTAFGVTSSDDLDFYVNALYRVALNNEVGCEPLVLDVLFKIYDALGQKCLNASDLTYIRNIFQKQKMIYIPSNGVQAAEWVTSEVCVWKGPEWLKTRRSLHGASKFSTCRQLFHVILKIPDAGWKDYLEDLKAMKLETYVQPAKVTAIYHRLCREFQDDSNSNFVRSLFETSQLVFVPSKNTWVNLSSCIWAEDETRIPEKESLKTAYLELEPFFHKLLGIPKPDIKMHVQGLIDLAENQTQPSELEIKGLINVTSALNPTADDVAELQGANIFFVKTQTGQKTRTNSAASFVIVDRLEYGAAFMGKISMLDYTLEEVNACKLLFHSLGMKKKYLSELVDEKTSVNDGVISTKLTESFRSKAYAFVRCTAHYAKRKEDNIALYKNLSNATIYVSNGIVKSMSVVQYGETTTVEKSRANFHLEENDEGLRLYVPQEENSRQLCMNRQLPKRLATFLHISDTEAQLVITQVITCGTLDAVDGILRDAGIVEVDGMVQSSDIAQKMYPSGNRDNSSEGGTQAFEAKTQTRTQSPCSYDTQAFRIFKENFQRFVNPHSANASATTERALSRRDFPLLKFLLESQFEEVAQGEFAWLHEVDRLGYTRVEIAELLFEELTDSPWIFFEPGSTISREMKLNFHLPNCAHTVLQAGIKSTTLSELASFQFETMDFVNVSTAQDTESILQQVSESCGLAGIVPSTGNLSTWIGHVVFEDEKTTSRVIYGSSEGINTDRDLIKCCTLALEGLSNAIGYFQHVSCCCDSFTILKSLEHENAKTIQMVRIRFELIDQLHRSLLEILRCPTDTSRTSSFQGCTLIVAKVLLIFGIPYSTETEHLIAENYQLVDRGNTIHSYCLAVQSLCLGFLSYSQAHCGKLQPFFLDTAQQKVLLQGSKLDPGSPWQLQVELLDLTCMGDMLDDSVLVFSAFKEDSKWLIPPTEYAYDLLASPQDLLDTWGPGHFVSLESEPTSGVFCAISLRGGTIKAADSEGRRFHWSRDIVYDAGPKSRFNAKDMLLVGASVTIKHDCPSDKHHLWENAGEEMSTLGTFEGYWKNAERQAGFQAGEYVSFVFQNVWAIQPGKSLKDCHLEQEPLSYSFLQSRWGLQISCCTGVARRVSLCELLADVMPDFVESLFPIPPLWEKLKQDHGIIQAFSGPSLQQWLKNLDEDCRILAVRITRYILSILRGTGIDHKGEYLTVSWPQKENPFQCLKLNCDKQNFWTRLLADSVDCATFAYITPNCLETTNLKCRGLVPNWYGDSALLDTAVCRHITSTEPRQSIPVAWTLKDKETYCMGKPDSMLMIRVERADPNAVPRLYVSPSSIPKLIIRRMFHSKKIRKALNSQKLRERQWKGGRSESVLILVRD